MFTRLDVGLSVLMVTYKVLCGGIMIKKHSDENTKLTHKIISYVKELINSSQFIKFGIVGVSNTGINLGIYYLLIYMNVNHIIANTVGFIVSVFNAYYWNNKYVFKKTSKGHIKPFMKTFMAYGMTFLISTGLLYLLVDCMGFSKVIAPLMVLIVTIPINFLFNKFWAFS